MVSVVGRPILSCVVAVFVVATLSIFIKNQSHVASLLLKSVGFVVFYCSFLLIMYNGYKPIHDLIAIRNLLSTDKEKFKHE